MDPQYLKDALGGFVGSGKKGAEGGGGTNGYGCELSRSSPKFMTDEKSTLHCASLNPEVYCH